MRPRALRDIGADLTADPVDRVARLAALGREDARAGYRVLARAEHGLGPCSVERDQRECDSDGPNPGSDHGRPFLSGLGDRRESFHPTVADATRIIPKSQQLLELQLQYPWRVRVPDLGIVEDCHAEGMFLSRLKAVPANWRRQRRKMPMTTRVRRLPTTREETETLP